LAALSNPAIQTFKEYPDTGYRWVELRQPEIDENVLPEGWSRTDDGLFVSPEGEYFEDNPVRRLAREQLQEALKFEGDEMGHCVGSYCDEVIAGSSRIFSLRDAKGQPHVTIETAPSAPSYETLRAAVGQEEANRLLDAARKKAAQAGFIGDRGLGWAFKQLGVDVPQNIIQIKGKANRAPVDEYLPYVQDFIKSGTWGEIGDLANAKLRRLPDGRYITEAQFAEGLKRGIRETNPGRSEDWYKEQERTYAVPSARLSDDLWAQIAPYFEGYAVGGRVDASRCFSRNPLSVRKR
jgi:hypothetical protein